MFSNGGVTTTIVPVKKPENSEVQRQLPNTEENKKNGEVKHHMNGGAVDSEKCAVQKEKLENTKDGSNARRGSVSSGHSSSCGSSEQSRELNSLPTPRTLPRFSKAVQREREQVIGK